MTTSTLPTRADRSTRSHRRDGGSARHGRRDVTDPTNYKTGVTVGNTRRRRSPARSSYAPPLKTHIISPTLPDARDATELEIPAVGLPGRGQEVHALRVGADLRRVERSGHLQAPRPAEVVLPSPVRDPRRLLALRRRMDGRRRCIRRAGRAPHRADLRAAADRARAADRPRRPRLVEASSVAGAPPHEWIAQPAAQREPHPRWRRHSIPSHSRPASSSTLQSVPSS